MGRVLGGGGGHCLFEGRYPLPDYHPCVSALSASQCFLLLPIFESQTTAPQNQTTLSTNVIQIFLHSFLYSEWHVFYKIR